MKRKHTRIIALIIVIAVVVTTVMSTVLAFADETDTDYDDSSYSEYEDPDDYEDSGDDWEDDWDDYDMAKKYDFSNVQLKQTSVVICSQDSSATVDVGLRGLPQMEEADSDYIDISDSQAKRMDKGYFDCSSLVWRAYHSQGINLMQKKWAPTAADLGKYLVGKHKKVASADWKNYEKLKFQVGDLLFETGENNGRYKGIYHVEMFGGYSFGGFDTDGQPILGTEFARLGGSTSSSDFLCRP